MDRHSKSSRYLGKAGPAPAPLLPTARAISSRSSRVSSRVAAPIHPSTCSGDRAPTMAPVTPGQARVQAIATAPTVVPCAAPRAEGNHGEQDSVPSRGGLKSGDRRRQSSSAMVSTRSSENRSVSSPDCSGLYPMTPVLWAAHQGISASAACRRMSERGGCSEST